MKKQTRLISVMMILALVTAITINGCGINIKGGDSGVTHGNVKEGGTLEIGVVNKGYGDKFAYELAKAFQEKTGIKTAVTKSSSATWTEVQMKAGAENNTLDIIFDINNIAMKNVAQKNFIAGYDCAYADLTDIYDQPLEGYDTEKTLEELVYPYSLRACTWGGKDMGFGNGKQYFVNWAAGIEGLVYNASLFEKYNLSVPKTTDELFQVMKQMKSLNNGSYATNENGSEIYPFVFAGKNDYTSYLTNVWWAQYDGEQAFNYVLEGKDANGVLSSNSMKAKGKLSALQIIADILDRDAKYTDASTCLGLSFTDAQMVFLDEQAFMIPTGDWLEREMEHSYKGGADIAFMPIPVNSDVIDKCTTIKTDKQLSEVISFIDGDVANRPTYVSDKDLAFVKKARSMYCSEGNQHIAYIPAYSDNIEAGKQFIQFMLSKAGQEIMLKYAYGNMAMLDVEMQKFESYESLSYLQKSKLKLMSFDGGATLVGRNYVYPMSYAGGAGLWYGTWANEFAAPKDSETYMTAIEYFQHEYNTNESYWNQWVAASGIDK